MKNFLILFSFLFLASFSFSQTTLEGKITDKETGEELIGASVLIKKNGAHYAAARY